jgi:hypothetical protein
MAEYSCGHHVENWKPDQSGHTRWVRYWALRRDGQYRACTRIPKTVTTATDATRAAPFFKKS